MIGPAIGSFFLLSSDNVRSTDLASVKTLYVAIGIVVIYGFRAGRTWPYAMAS